MGPPSERHTTPRHMLSMKIHHAVRAWVSGSAADEKPKLASGILWNNGKRPDILGNAVLPTLNDRFHQMDDSLNSSLIDHLTSDGPSTVRCLLQHEPCMPEGFGGPQKHPLLGPIAVSAACSCEPLARHHVYEIRVDRIEYPHDG